MFYWLGVYGLVIGAVLAPLLLLYVVAAILWLALAAIRFMIQGLKSVWPTLTFVREHWSIIHR